MTVRWSKALDPIRGKHVELCQIATCQRIAAGGKGCVDPSLAKPEQIRNQAAGLANGRRLHLVRPTRPAPPKRSTPQ